MKAFVVVNNYPPSGLQDKRGWYLLADSAITNTGKPFYIPDFKEDVVVSLCVAVKITRLGKAISSNFAPGYYSEYAPALHFYCSDYGKALEREGLPADPSRNFDRALFVGEFRPLSESQTIELLKNGEMTASFSFNSLVKPVEEILSWISRMNTMKIGDLLIPALSGKEKVNEGDMVEVRIEGVRAFHVRIK